MSAAPHGLLLARDRATLLIVDIQEAFRKAIPTFDTIAANAAILAQAARTLGVPIVVTEQYPRGLGETVPEVAEHLGDVEALEKIEFSAARAEGFALDPGRNQVLVCGIEAHVCVSQTVHDLLAAGRQVHVATDAVASRSPENRALGLERMERAGAIPSSVETALFELLGRAGSDEFKAVQQLVR